jgi:hypothetical protein
MYEYAVEFDLPGISSLPADRVRDLARAFGAALDARTSGVRWINTFVAPHTLRLVYIAPSLEALHTAAMRGNLMPDRVFELWEGANEADGAVDLRTLGTQTAA